jgi:hypothetical protein
MKQFPELVCFHDNNPLFSAKQKGTKTIYSLWLETAITFFEGDNASG